MRFKMDKIMSNNNKKDLEINMKIHLRNLINLLRCKKINIFQYRKLTFFKIHIQVVILILNKPYFKMKKIQD